MLVSGKKALCVGINKFKNIPRATLQGCVNDCNDMASVLTDILGFNASTDITKLTDEKATKANIITNLKDMVSGAKAGKYNYLVFSISSHGTHIPDRNGDEADYKDEAFCPYDLAQKGDQWDPNYIISDDELRDIFIQLPQNVLLEVYLDTCHSGTGLKSIDMLLDRQPRYLPPPSLKAFRNVEGLRRRRLREALLEKGLVHHVLWAACRDDQTSADAHIAGGYHGAFTYYFCKELRQCKNKLSRSELLGKIRQDLKSSYNQVPQLESEATVRSVPILK